MIDKFILSLKKIIFYYFDFFKIREKNAISKVKNITKDVQREYPASKYKIGIVKEKWHLHSHYVKGCQELGISYIVIDFFQFDWWEQLKSAEVDFLMVRPSVQYTPWKDMFDNRLRIISNTNIKIFPNVNALWIWESKLRTLEWLKINNISHVSSFVFYDNRQVLQFGEKIEYPIVYKSSSGSGASGVKILKNFKDLKNISTKVFEKGIRTYRKHKLDKEHGFIILQMYLKNVKEWRIIRIGEFYFGYEKIKKGQFHSGSQEFGYGMPPEEVLDLVRSITEEYDFNFVDVDIFVSEDGNLFVNEIQPYFGQKDDRELLVIDNIPGRLYFSEKENKWVFEKGEFCRNNMCNLRITETLKMFL
ncbi:RimK family alpha-L-glutamate ligase [Gillisia sp. Q332]|uniref:ATP-grasp domain-containing protein n=1 Tax=Gillisia xinjiangensis TaxID=3384765 RepID=UPI00391C3A08